MKGVKIRIPPKGSEELDRFYDLVFNPLGFNAGWAGRIGHYPFDRDGYAAPNQDGFVYLFEYSNFYRMTADSQFGRSMHREWVEVVI